MSESAKSKLVEWRTKISSFTRSQELPHASNLLRKLSLPAAKSTKWLRAFETIIPDYIRFHNSKIKKSGHPKSPYYKIVHNVNKYLETLRTPECNIFSHQSDFCSSVIPEFFYVLFSNLVKKVCSKCEVSAQRDLIVECMFDSTEGGRAIFKRKIVDTTIYLPAKFEFSGKIQNDFCIPLLAMEIKTNMDKNMISGIEHAVESLKRTFPKCLYFAVCEFADFDIKKQNYASTKIDEIFILRKQKRSKMRRGQAIQKIDLKLIEYLADSTLKHLKIATLPVSSLKDRIENGMLICRPK